MTNANNNQNEINVGVDTGKTQLDIYIRPLDVFFTVSNDGQGIKEAIVKCQWPPESGHFRPLRLYHFWADLIPQF